ncbi:hypothetical protein [Streptomyces sp. WM6378]|uniref:hypothetical protein n=1 Tax=Streptomyces sp. WM6378 TaxID=1415557 RepID=UPI0006AE806D|nr:hypothetical protein [Streptomyces sp. WM6378]KOU40107.1 hypothetical protein ADK54_23150 [Streptomyces sp. WM6378]
MAADNRLQIYSVEESSGDFAVCIARCVGGVVRTGQNFAMETASEPVDFEHGVTLTAIDRYGRSVDFFDPPHAAKVYLSGPGASVLEPGMILAARG